MTRDIKITTEALTELLYSKGFCEKNEIISDIEILYNNILLISLDNVDVTIPPVIN